MSDCKMAVRVAAPIASTAIFGSIGAAAGAFAGAIGAEILDASGYSGYNAVEAAQMGAVGGAVINGAAGFLAGSLAACGLFGGSDSDSDKEKKKTVTEQAVAYTAGTVIAGLTGYGIMNSGHYETIMELGQTAAAFAIGGAVTMIPATCALTCIAVPLVLAAVALAEHEQTNHTSLPAERAFNIV